MISITPNQMDQFRRAGYLRVEALLDPTQDLDPVFREYTGVLDGLANTRYAKRRQLLAGTREGGYRGR